MRVAAADAVFGVFCRRFGVPLIDGLLLRPFPVSAALTCCVL
jgi:hypothetical protein